MELGGTQKRRFAHKNKKKQVEPSVCLSDLTGCLCPDISNIEGGREKLTHTYA